MKENVNVQIVEENFRIKACLDPFNQRVRVDDAGGNMDEIIMNIERLAKNEQAEKLIFKARREQLPHLLENGYVIEGMIDGYFRGSDSLLLSKYFSAGRRSSSQWMEEDSLFEKVSLLSRDTGAEKVPEAYSIRIVSEKDAAELADLYKRVFRIYPTPLHSPEYIKKTMEQGTEYIAFENGGKLVSVAAAEIDMFYLNAELTDCATLNEHRAHGLMKHLLLELEKKLVNQGVYCSYSLARSLSFGMNAALHQLGYSYRGRLPNNCYIFDSLEDMNIWVKDLAAG